MVEAVADVPRHCAILLWLVVVCGCVFWSSLCCVDCRLEYPKLVECFPPQHLVECNHPRMPHVNTRLNEMSIHMCLEVGEELFKAINYGGKDELFLYTSVWLYSKKKGREYIM